MATRMIDLRSDTLTRPSKAMREAMASADVGDDVFGEDPTVNRLQDRIAEVLGKERALFVASGTMGNQLCIKTHTHAGDEVIAEAGAHVFFYETAGAAFLSSVQIYQVKGTRGVLPIPDVQQAIRPDIYYMPRTRLLCLENTHNRAGGAVYPLDSFAAITRVAHDAGLRVHLDGARLWNASVASGVSAAEYCRHVDSVSVCLSKGLGAPVGSVIAGTKEFIDEARHFRKIFGGGMRQAGILAAAGLYALDHHVDRLADDHARARAFAETVAAVPGIAIDLATVQTNIVIMDMAGTGTGAGEWARRFAEVGVRVSQASEHTLRAVTHLDVREQDVRDAAAAIVRTVSAGRS